MHCLAHTRRWAHSGLGWDPVSTPSIPGSGIHQGLVGSRHTPITHAQPYPMLNNTSPTGIGKWEAEVPGANRCLTAHGGHQGLHQREDRSLAGAVRGGGGRAGGIVTSCPPLHAAPLHTSPHDQPELPTPASPAHSRTNPVHAPDPPHHSLRLAKSPQTLPRAVPHTRPHTPHIRITHAMPWVLCIAAFFEGSTRRDVSPTGGRRRRRGGGYTTNPLGRPVSGQ